MSSSGAELPCHLEDSFSVTSRIILYCALGDIYDVNVFIYMYQYACNSVLACKRKLYESIKTGLSRNPYSFRQCFDGLYVHAHVEFRAQLRTCLKACMHYSFQ